MAQTASNKVRDNHPGYISRAALPGEVGFDARQILELSRISIFYPPSRCPFVHTDTHGLQRALT